MSSLKEAIENNYNVLDKLGCKSKDIKIVNKLKWKNYNIVGFTIRNIGKDIIKGINIANYKSGRLEKIDLKPDEELIIPTKWLILLLFRPEYCLTVSNGEFISKKEKVSDNIDEICRNYELKDEEYIAEEKLFTNSFTLKKEYKYRFSYLENDAYYKGFSFLRMITKDNGDCKCLIRH